MINPNLALPFGGVSIFRKKGLENLKMRNYIKLEIVKGASTGPVQTVSYKRCI